MSDAPRGPRVILEEAERAAPRLDFEWEQAVVPVAAPRPAGRWSGLGRAATGAAVLGLGLAALDSANFVVDQFGRGPVQGWATLGVVLGGFGLLTSGIWREMRGLLGIRAVERARAAFARGDLADARAEALRWAGGVAEAAPLLPALREAGSTEENGRPAGSRAAAIARPAGRGAGPGGGGAGLSVTAVSPSPGLDALIFAWRGVRLVRQVAALHGLRPGLFGTVSLVRRTLLDAATVAVTDVAVDTAARALLSNKLLERNSPARPPPGRWRRGGCCGWRISRRRPAGSSRRGADLRQSVFRSPWLVETALAFVFASNYSVQVIPPERSLLYSGSIPARASTPATGRSRGGSARRSPPGCRPPRCSPGIAAGRRPPARAPGRPAPHAATAPCRAASSPG